MDSLTAPATAIVPSSSTEWCFAPTALHNMLNMTSDQSRPVSGRRNALRSPFLDVDGSALDGWFWQEIERAPDIQNRDRTFRAIPPLLPDAPSDRVSQFLGFAAGYGKPGPLAYFIFPMSTLINGENSGNMAASPIFSVDVWFCCVSQCNT